MKRYDPDNLRGTMIESEDGDFVRFDDAQYVAFLCDCAGENPASFHIALPFTNPPECKMHVDHVAAVLHDCSLDPSGQLRPAVQLAWAVLKNHIGDPGAKHAWANIIATIDEYFR